MAGSFLLFNHILPLPAQKATTSPVFTYIFFKSEGGEIRIVNTGK